jgi:hypothetical protein
MKFNLSELSSEFSVYLKIINKEEVVSYKLNVPANGDINSIKCLIEELEIINEEGLDYRILSNKGVEVKDFQTFEELNLQSDDKFLLAGTMKIENKISRFPETCDYWYCNPDGIVFSVNKRIKLTGIGLYMSVEGGNLSGTLSIYEVEGEAQGRSRRGRGRLRNNIADNGYSEDLIYEQEAVVNYDLNNSEKIVKITLKKPINIKAFSDYKVLFNSSLSTELWYGEGGKATVLGEKRVEFMFKQSHYDSNFNMGNFPEFYYYV